MNVLTLLRSAISMSTAYRPKAIESNLYDFRTELTSKLKTPDWESQGQF